MAPRKTQSKQPKSRPSGNGSTMDEAEKRARHITSEKTRLTNIKTGLAAMLPMLPPEIQRIPGIAKSQTKILDAFGDAMARELQLERDLEAEKDMLELHSKNGTFPTASDYLLKSCLPTPPDTQENPAYKPASKKITDFGSQDINRIPSNEPKYSTISGCGAHQTDIDLSFQQTIPAAFNFNSYPADSTPSHHPYISNSPSANPHQTYNDINFQQTIPAAFNSNSYPADSTPGHHPYISNSPSANPHQTYNDINFQQTIPAAFNSNSYPADSTPGHHPYISNSPDANPHQENNDLGFQTNNMQYYELDQTGLDFSQFTFSNMNNGPSNGPNDAADWTMGFQVREDGQGLVIWTKHRASGNWTE